MVMVPSPFRSLTLLLFFLLSNLWVNYKPLESQIVTPVSLTGSRKNPFLSNIMKHGMLWLAESSKMKQYLERNGSYSFVKWVWGIDRHDALW